MDMNPRAETLRSLVQLDYDAAEAYSAALERIQSPELARQLEAFRADHVRHVWLINGLLEKMGEPAAQPAPDLKGVVLRGFTATLSARSDEAALMAMVGNEGITNSTYRDVLELDWTPREREVLARNYADEQRHLAWIRQALALRSWEAEGLHP